MARSMRTKPQFETEAALCADFIAALPKDWTAYPETAGWDILLVRRQDGFQIGIQAKLKLNLSVINQTIKDGHVWWNDVGPNCRAVLVPSDQSGFGRIASYIGFAIIRMHSEGAEAYRLRFAPELPVINSGPGYGLREWSEWCPTRLHTLPEYVPDVAAGAPAPLQLTKWKISAIKIAATIELRGYVTRGDFHHHGIDHRRWTAREGGWLIPSSTGIGYVAGPNLPPLKEQHPRVWAEIIADRGKWLPKELLA